MNGAEMSNEKAEKQRVDMKRAFKAGWRTFERWRRLGQSFHI
jgi:hypothetical protein